MGKGPVLIKHRILDDVRKHAYQLTHNSCFRYPRKNRNRWIHCGAILLPSSAEIAVIRWRYGWASIALYWRNTVIYLQRPYSAMEIFKINKIFIIYNAIFLHNLLTIQILLHLQVQLHNFFYYFRLQYININISIAILALQ